MREVSNNNRDGNDNEKMAVEWVFVCCWMKLILFHLGEVYYHRYYNIVIILVAFYRSRCGPLWSVFIGNLLGFFLSSLNVYLPALFFF